MWWEVSLNLIRCIKLLLVGRGGGFFFRGKGKNVNHVPTKSIVIKKQLIMPVHLSVLTTVVTALSADEPVRGGGEGVDVGSHGWQWQCDMDVCAVKQLQAQLFPVCNKGNFYWSVSLPPTAIARFLYFTIRPLYSISMRIGFVHASLVYYIQTLFVRIEGILERIRAFIKTLTLYFPLYIDLICFYWHY